MPHSFWNWRCPEAGCEFAIIHRAVRGAVRDEAWEHLMRRHGLKIGGSTNDRFPKLDITKDGQVRLV